MRALAQHAKETQRLFVVAFLHGVALAIWWLARREEWSIYTYYNRTNYSRTRYVWWTGRGTQCSLNIKKNAIAFFYSSDLSVSARSVCTPYALSTCRRFHAKIGDRYIPMMMVIGDHHGSLGRLVHGRRKSQDAEARSTEPPRSGVHSAPQTPTARLSPNNRPGDVM